MEVTVRSLTENKEVLNACRMTVWKNRLEKEPSVKFMNNIYFSGHSPIRDKWFVIEILGVESFVATHFVRHHVGMTPYVSTCRDDRINYEMDVVPDRNTPVNIRMTINAESFINISRKRLCNMSHRRTVEVWQEVLKCLKDIDPTLERYCVRNCVYRGGICPEIDSSCKYIHTARFKKELSDYLGAYKKDYFGEECLN